MWSKPDSRVPFMQKATYTQAADSLRGVKHSKGDRLSNATTRFSAHIERWHEYAKHTFL